jgi:uncharacterized peroxidase-related enzyme
MAFISGISDEMVVADIFKWSQEAGDCISQWHQIVMRGDSPLSKGEREFIAAYTSSVNACSLCYGVHKLIAEQFGIDAEIFENLVNDIDGAPVDEKLKPLLHYAKKLTLEPSKMTQADADAVFAAGWNEQALHDAINVICMFNFMNRIVLGHGGTDGDISPHYQMSADFLAQKGYVAEGAP